MKTVIMKLLSNIYKKVFRKNYVGGVWPNEIERKNANRAIFDLLNADKPCFIGRMGTTEGAVINNYITVHSDISYFKKLLNYITDKTRLPWWNFPRLDSDLCKFSGFFPGGDLKELEKFAELYLKYIPTMDLVGRFSYYEKFLPFNSKCQFFQLEALYPFFVEHSWMKALEGKKVLVIHPFKETIEKQYEKRAHLFPSKDWLPDFKSLTVIKAVQTLAGEKCKFANWFEALDSMIKQIDQADFDVALIGCGAYGLPLAAHCKEIGKKGFHVGGGLQLLFGIKGNRWESQYTHSCYRDLFNEYWVYPDESEKIKNASSVESGCYW